MSPDFISFRAPYAYIQFGVKENCNTFWMICSVTVNDVSLPIQISQEKVGLIFSWISTSLKHFVLSKFLERILRQIYNYEAT